MYSTRIPEYSILPNIRNPECRCKNCGRDCLPIKDYCNLECRDAAKYKRRKERERLDALTASVVSASQQVPEQLWPWSGPGDFPMMVDQLRVDPKLSPAWLSGVPENHGWTPPDDFTLDRMSNGNAMLALKPENAREYLAIREEKLKSLKTL